MPQFTQAGRPMRVSTPLGGDALLIERLSGTEAVSEPFELVLDLLSTDAAIDPDKLLRKPVVLAIDLVQGGTRQFHGLVRRFVQLGRGDGLVSYRAEVVPAIWFLSLSTDCRIYQQKSVPDIVKEVLSEMGITDVKLSLSGTYAPREYCVQYRETHLAFISRLLEEEGIFYFFEHTKDKHTLVLGDAPAAVKAGSVPKLPVTFVEGGNMDFAEYVTGLEIESLVCSGKVTLADYNEATPKLRLQGSVAGAAPKASAANLAVFDYPGKFGAPADGERLARLRLEERESLGRVATGLTNCRALGSGQKLEISHHYRRDFNQAYHLLSLKHTAHAGGYRSTAETNDDAFHFESTFVAIPHAVPYRPPCTTEKSLVHGTQTAVVVGPPGEEIFVDKNGRVKVQFFWDRVGKHDDHSSCWVRVSSAWAGKNWGHIQIPRVGQEVLVDFLEGDPDHPIVTGRVYNAEQMVPYTLPDQKTQSGVKTHTSKGGTGFNELRFDDKTGSEEVWVHAEKNLWSVVKNDETRDIGHDRITTIKNDETKSVTDGNETITIAKGNQSLTIAKGNQVVTIGEGDQTISVSKGDQTISVDKGKQMLTIDKDRTVVIQEGDDSLTVKMGDLATEVSQGNHATKVSMGNVTLKAGVGTISYDAMQGIELKVGQNSVKIDQTGITIKGMMISIEGQVQTELKGLLTTVNADAMLTVKGAITMIN